MPHKQRPEEEDTTYVYSRASDRSLWLKTSYLIDKYKLLWIPLLAILTAFGFGFRTPKQTADALQQQIDTIKSVNLTAKTRYDTLEKKVDILLKVPCLDKNRNTRDLILIGVDCSQFPQPESHK